jgi:hypothetical protein
MLADGPVAYQACLSKLLVDGISSPEDKEGAWEGNAELFKACEDRCKKQCKRDQSDWDCVGWSDGKNDPKVRAWVAVYVIQADGSRVPVPGALVKACTPAGGCSEDEGHEAEADGVLELEIGPASVYFAVTRGSSTKDFPPTYFYPVHLSSDPWQPITIYVVSTAAVTVGNNVLMADAGVDADMIVDQETGLLRGAAQSVILPDACREQDTPSAIGVTFQVRDLLLRRCEERTKIGSGPPVPCIWYGLESSGFPELTHQHTKGWGGGIVGLAEREHEVRVCDSDGKIVASRRLRMQIGWLTVARTWPLSSAEQASAGNCD